MQVRLLYADAVQFDPAQLGSGPAEALGYFLAGEARGLTEPPQLSGESATANGNALFRHVPGTPLMGISGCDFTAA